MKQIIVLIILFISKSYSYKYEVKYFSSNIQISWSQSVGQYKSVSLYSMVGLIDVSYNQGRNLNVQQLIVPQQINHITVIPHSSNASILIMYQDLPYDCTRSSIVYQSINEEKWNVRLLYSKFCSSSKTKTKLLFVPIYPRNLIWAKQPMAEILEQRMLTMVDWMKTQNTDHARELTEIEGQYDKLDFNVLRRLNYHGFFILKVELKNSSVFYFPPLLISHDEPYKAPSGTNTIVIGAIVFAGLFILIFHCFESVQILFSCWCILLTVYAYAMRLTFFTYDNSQIFDNKGTLWFFVIFYGLGPIFGFICSVMLIYFTKAKSKARNIPIALCLGYISMSLLYCILALYKLTFWLLLLISCGIGVLVFGVTIKFTKFARSFGGVFIGCLIVTVSVSFLVCEVSIIPYIFIDFFTLVYSTAYSSYLRFVFITWNDLILILCLIMVTAIFGSVSMGVNSKKKKKKTEIKPTQNSPVTVPAANQAQYGAVHYHQEAVIVQIHQNNVIPPSPSNQPGPSSQAPPVTDNGGAAAPPRYSHIIGEKKGQQCADPPSYKNNDHQFDNATAPPPMMV